MRFLPAGVIGATALLLLGCGGKSSDVASRINVKFPPQSYNFSTSLGTIALVSQVILADQPGISKGAALVDITIPSLGYSVSKNMLAGDLPALTLYMAPSGVGDPGDPQALRFGAVPPIPAGTDASGDVQLMSTSVETIEMFTGNTSIPFNLIALTANAVPGASPQGIAYLTLTVSGSLTAYAVAPGGG